MSITDSFDQFEHKFGPGQQYAPMQGGLAADLAKRGFPDYYVRYLERNGFLEFFNGFWWFTNPLELHEELAPFADGQDVFPILRNAFGCFLVRHEENYYHLNVHYRNFALLGPHLAILINLTTGEHELQNMYFSDYFTAAFERLGRVASDEMYAFAPALKIGGTVNAEGVHIVKLREHLAFLAQL